MSDEEVNAEILNAEFGEDVPNRAHAITPEGVGEVYFDGYTDDEMQQLGDELRVRMMGDVIGLQVMGMDKNTALILGHMAATFSGIIDALKRVGVEVCVLRPPDGRTLVG